jgi:hypothetical protein
MKRSSQPRSRRNLGLLAIAALALAVTAGGCVTTPKTSLPLTLKASGDPGVTVEVTSSLPGVPPQVATVPAELQFHGSAYELRCVHGPQPGRLKLIAARGGIQISTGDTLKPGEVTVFKIRPGEIAVGPAPSGK